RGDSEKREQAIEGLVKPIREMLDRQQQAIAQLDRDRVKDRAGLDQQLRMMAAAHERLGQETGRLVTALRRPEQRGRWGELQLRNVVELAGMAAHCDFVEQPTVSGEQGLSRPDMVVRLPGGGTIVVDAKVALDAYLQTLEPDVDRQEMLTRHARQVADHVRGLAGRRYWQQFERSPRMVVMFVPLEAAFSAALEARPDLHAEAMKSHVLIATPMLLMALLRTIAHGWQQEHVATNAREISRVGRDLYGRLATFVEHLEKLGSSLKRAGQAYNTAIGSLEARVLPSTRELKTLHVTNDADIQCPAPLPVDVRPVSAAELKPPSEDPEPGDRTDVLMSIAPKK
ncbi:MAG: DNA recombination protein RmuC, partial [Planctomycetota bacterium]